MPSFDIVSKIKWHEVDNALNQAQKELAQRFDFKDTGTELEKSDAGITIRSSSEDRADAALTVLQEKLIKRRVSLKFFDVEDPKKTAKGGSSMKALSAVPLSVPGVFSSTTRFPDCRASPVSPASDRASASAAAASPGAPR